MDKFGLMEFVDILMAVFSNASLAEAMLSLILCGGISPLP